MPKPRDPFAPPGGVGKIPNPVIPESVGGGLKMAAYCKEASGGGYFDDWDGDHWFPDGDASQINFPFTKTIIAADFVQVQPGNPDMDKLEITQDGIYATWFRGRLYTSGVVGTVYIRQQSDGGATPYNTLATASDTFHSNYPAEPAYGDWESTQISMFAMGPAAAGTELHIDAYTAVEPGGVTQLSVDKPLFIIARLGDAPEGWTESSPPSSWTIPF